MAKPTKKDMRAIVVAAVFIGSGILLAIAATALIFALKPYVEPHVAQWIVVTPLMFVLAVIYGVLMMFYRAGSNEGR